MAAGLVAAKLTIVLVILLVPSGMEISVSAAHGVAMLVLLLAGMVALLVARRRGRTVRELLVHGLLGRHRLVLHGRRQPNGGQQQ